jgi:histone-lysine N-methyltransferase SETMAR
LHDNTPAHPALVTQKKLAYLGFHCLDHISYFLDLATSDYHLFPVLKKQLKCRYFASDVEVIGAADTWLDGQATEFFFEWHAKVRATG